MTIWISKFLGPIIIALGIPMMITPAAVQETTRRFLDDSPLVLISGILAMTAGLAIVNTHNVWALDWTLIVTLFGWALMLSGASRLVAPALVDRVGGRMMDRPLATRIAGLVWVLLGVFLTYQGYFRAP